MKQSREQVKAELMKKMEEVVERILEWQESNPKIRFRELEEEVLEMREEVGEVLVETLVGQVESRQPAIAPICSQCGARMTDKGQRSRQVVSRTGKVTVQRGYYQCLACGESFFPSG
jgi:hypothetical protein